MSVRLQMIGTGSAFAKKYYNNNALISIPGYKLMIDFGYSATRAFYDMNMSLNEIDGVLITHLHADHIGGLEELAFRMKYEYQKRLDMYIPSQLIKPLWTNALQAGLENPSESFTTLHDYFNVIALEEDHIHTIHNDLQIEILRTQHIPGKPSYSLIINRAIFFSADAQFSRELLEDLHHVRGCTTIFHDCQLFSPGTVHATLEQLLTLPPAIQRKTLLMHYGDNMEHFIGKTGLMSFVQQQQVYEFAH